MCTEDVFDSLTAVPNWLKKRVVLKSSNDGNSNSNSNSSSNINRLIVIGNR